MDSQYMEECTKDWILLDEGSNSLKLFSFFDMVDWETQYAIKKDSMVLTTFDRHEGNPYSIFEIVKQCF